MGRDCRRSCPLVGLLALAVFAVLASAQTRAFGTEAAGAAGVGALVQALPPTSPSVPAAVETERIPRRAFEVLAEIQRREGEPPSGYRGGELFRNRERRLPPGRYREYDIHPWVRGRNRGPERLVIERRSGKAYYTADHYNTFIPMN